jgi:hypothetical protein
VAIQEFKHGGRLAAGQDQAVDSGQLGWLAHLDGLCAALGQGLGVGRVVALDGEDADARVLRSVKALSFRLALSGFFGSTILHKEAITLSAKICKIVAELRAARVKQKILDRLPWFLWLGQTKLR